jgi:hypothetical protein
MSPAAKELNDAMALIDATVGGATQPLRPARFPQPYPGLIRSVTDHPVT